MALGKTSTIIDLINAVSVNDMAQAKQCVIKICDENTLTSYDVFCDRIKRHIQSQPHLAELSFAAKGMLYTEDVTLFDEELYFVSQKEQVLLERMQTMEHTAAKLQAAGIRYRNAALLFGPSGSGKTAFAKYIAKKMGRDFYMVNIATVIDAHMGGTSKNLETIFSAVGAAGGNCLLLLDELDALSNNREPGKAGGLQQSPDRELSRATMALMQQLDLLPPEVVLLAATNRIEALDLAIKRRFPVHHSFHPFSESERRDMITKYLTTIKSRAAFQLEWDPEALETFVKDTKMARQSAIIDALNQCIADMVEDGLPMISFPKKESPAWSTVIQTIQN